MSDFSFVDVRMTASPPKRHTPPCSTYDHLYAEIPVYYDPSTAIVASTAAIPTMPLSPSKNFTPLALPGNEEEDMLAYCSTQYLSSKRTLVIMIMHAVNIQR